MKLDIKSKGKLVAYDWADISVDAIGWFFLKPFSLKLAIYVLNPYGLI